MNARFTPKKGVELARGVTITVTQQEMLLLKLCLGIVKEQYAKAVSLNADIQRLTDKLQAEEMGNA